MLVRNREFIFCVSTLMGLWILLKMGLGIYYISLCHLFSRADRSNGKLLKRIKEEQTSAKGQASCTAWLERSRFFLLRDNLLVRLCEGVGILPVVASVMQATAQMLLHGSKVELAVEASFLRESIFLALFVASLSVGVYILVECVFPLQRKRKQAFVLLREALLPENVEGSEEKTEAKVVKKPARSLRRAHGRALEEKKRLTEELLRERREMSAEYFARQRNDNTDAAASIETEETDAVATEPAEAAEVKLQKKEAEKGKEATSELSAMMKQLLAEYLQ